jgi:hypothetical protein
MSAAGCGFSGDKGTTGNTVRLAWRSSAPQAHFDLFLLY